MTLLLHTCYFILIHYNIISCVLGEKDHFDMALLQMFSLSCLKGIAIPQDLGNAMQKGKNFSQKCTVYHSS